MGRITGLATGLDTDSLISETMAAERTKIDNVEKQKKVVELQQEMYREVIGEFRDFYSKYFDISKSDSIMLQKNWATVSFESTSSSVVTATAVGGASVDNYDVKVVQLAEVAKCTVKTDDISKLEKFTVNGKEVTVDFSKAKTDEEKAALINEQLSEHGLTAKYSSFAKGIVISSKETGSKQEFTINYDSADVKATGKDAKVYITNGSNEKITYTGSTNSTTIDGVNFKFNSVNATEDNAGNVTVTKEATIIGKSDTSSTKDMIVKFVSDYNNMMIKLNTLVTEKRNTSYMPLTSDEKEAMTDKEIELWEAKVKKGQLSRDSDLTRIRNSMKSAMSTFSQSNGLSLEKIGITPISDYSGTKNGTYTIDEEKLMSALEKDGDSVRKLFVNSTEDASGSPQGIFNKIKSTLDKETQSSTGSLIQKAGMEGSATASNNALTKKIAAYETKLSQMETLFTKKENALYSKYATLETLMNNLNSQTSYLQSMFSS